MHATPDPACLAVTRDHPEGRLLQLYNVSEEPVRVPHWWLVNHGVDPWTCVEHLAGSAPRMDGENLVLAGYQSVWLT